MHAAFGRTALFLLVGFAALFETVRETLWRLGSSVGGVGGIGGLTNQFWTDYPKACEATAPAYRDLFCFQHGIFSGFTTMALITTLFWISPLILIAIGGMAESHFASSNKRIVSANSEPDGNAAHPALLTDQSSPSSSQQDLQSERNLEVFKFGWVLLSLIWFANPAVQYLSAEFYQQSFSHVVLGVAIPAAVPLSWTAMLLSMPMAPGSAADVVLGLKSKSHLVQAHIFMAKWLLFWVCVHAGGEIYYLAATRTLWSSLNVVSDGENVLYLLGVIMVVLVMAQMVLALYRSKWRPTFDKLHLPIAMLLLVLVTMHWWAFVFFMLPSSVVHAHKGAKKLMGGTEAIAQKNASPVALLVATVMGLVMLSIVWYARQQYMENQDANRYIPFLFAAGSIVASTMGAFLGAGVAFRLYSRS